MPRVNWVMLFLLKLRPPGRHSGGEEVFGTIEAVKTVSDLFMPMGGEILEMNPLLDSSPDVVNKDPYGKGWMVKVQLTDPAEEEYLLTAEQYKKLI